MLYNLFEKGFLKHLHRKYGKKTTGDNMLFAFHDLEGYQYYTFTKDLGLPMCRIAKVNDYYSWLQRGIDVKEHELLLDKMSKSMEGGIKDGKGLATIGFIIGEMKTRVGMIVHEDLYYNILAVQHIRSDEDASKFNQQIHNEKIEAFKRMDNENDTFFLATKEFRKQLKYSDITREELLKKFLESSRLKQNLLNYLNSI